MVMKYRVTSGWVSEIGDLGAYMKNAVSRVFRGFELTVTMGQLRSIQIFVVGQARRPGTSDLLT